MKNQVHDQPQLTGVRTFRVVVRGFADDTGANVERLDLEQHAVRVISSLRNSEEGSAGSNAATWLAKVPG